jgi:hypothetical protein
MFISGAIIGMDRQKTNDFDKYQAQMMAGEVICFYDPRDESKVYAIPHDENFKSMARKMSQTLCGHCHEGM